MTLTETELGLLIAGLALSGVVFGSLVAGGFALLTGWLESKRRQREWLRDKRYAANLGFLTELHMENTTGVLDKQALRRYSSEALLLGPLSLLDPLSDLADAEVSGDADAKRTARSKYLVAVQGVLKIREPERRATLLANIEKAESSTWKREQDEKEADAAGRGKP